MKQIGKKSRFRSKQTKSLQSSSHFERRAKLLVHAQSQAMRGGLVRLALDVGGIGIFETDLLRRRMRFSPELCALLRLPRAREIPCEDALLLIDQRDRAAVQESIEAAAGREKWSGMFRVLCGDGAVRWVSVHERRRHRRLLGALQAVSSVGTVMDITDLMAAQDALRQDARRLRAALDAGRVGIFWWDAEAGRISWANEQFYKIINPATHRYARSKLEFIHEHLEPRDARALEAALRNAGGAKGLFPIICRTKAKGGRRRWLQFDGKFVASDAGEPALFVGVATDITECKTLLARTLRLSQHLATAQVEERRAVAEELHKSTVQQLVAAGLFLANLRTEMPLQGKAESICDDAEAALNEAIRNVRTFSYLMQPPAIGAGNLCDSIQRYVDGFAERSAIQITVRSSRSIDELPRAKKKSILALVQEALADVYRHVMASRTTVHIRWIGTHLHLIVANDGRRLAREPAPVRGPAPRVASGLRGIRLLVARMRGRLKIGRMTPRSIGLHASLPVGARSLGRRRHSRTGHRSRRSSVSSPMS